MAVVSSKNVGCGRRSPGGAVVSGAKWAAQSALSSLRERDDLGLADRLPVHPDPLGEAQQVGDVYRPVR